MSIKTLPDYTIDSRKEGLSGSGVTHEGHPSVDAPHAQLGSGTGLLAVLGDDFAIPVQVREMVFLVATPEDSVLFLLYFKSDGAC